MAIAVSAFNGFCGFRSLEEITAFLKVVLPLRKLVGEGEADAFINTTSSGGEKHKGGQRNKSALRSLYMSASNNTISQALADLAITHPTPSQPQIMAKSLQRPSPTSFPA